MHQLPWGDLPMIFTSDEVTSENHWQIASRVTQKSFFTVLNVSFYFLHAILSPDEKISLKKHHWSFISQLSSRRVFSDLALWCYHSWSVTSRKRGVLALWHHIRRLFLHVPIGAKAIFIREWQPWISISHHPVFTAWRVRKAFHLLARRCPFWHTI